MRLKKYRIESGLKAVQIAEKIGVSKGAYSRYEGGTRIPRPATIDKIEKVTGGKVQYKDFR